ADSREFIGTFIAWCQEQPRTKFQFAIVLLAEERLIGTCGIRLARTVGPHNDRFSAREADIGYELDSRFWGHGYATEAVRALLAFGFEQLGLHRIWAHCLAENVASIRLLERIGMRREGHLRENEWQQGHWHDTLIYAMLAQEWEGQA
ncbi:MAG TPA: GNAT family protein, partial [Nitrolancea sp.]|nr:GNAT family protein [Nitrolancea sp.]